MLLFVVIGRANHDKGETLAGIASTAWPFLAGLALGWFAARAWRRPRAIVPAGLGAWIGTVAFGNLLRVWGGQGTAFAFILVALAFLGLFLLGWRLVARLLIEHLRRKAGHREPDGRPARAPGRPSCVITGSGGGRRPR